ncbi:hypothetical protein Ancab_016229 [Ancistrocladus abbreviatus]
MGCLESDGVSLEHVVVEDSPFESRGGIGGLDNDRDARSNQNSNDSKLGYDWKGSTKMAFGSKSQDLQ